MTGALFITDDLVFFVFLSEKSTSPYSPQSCKWANLSGRRFFIFSFHKKFTQWGLPKEKKYWLFFFKAGSWPLLKSCKWANLGGKFYILFS